MKIYVASHDKNLAIEAAAQLRQAGHEITSSWLDQEFRRTSEHAPEERVAIAKTCADEVTQAAAAVLIATPEGVMVPGGKFVEAGIALGQGKPVYVVGRRENMLTWHPMVWQFEDVPALLAGIGRAY